MRKWYYKFYIEYYKCLLFELLLYNHISTYLTAAYGGNVKESTCFPCHSDIFPFATMTHHYISQSNEFIIDCC